jgi:hypothetical protein
MKMLSPNPPGFHTKLTQEKIEKLISAVPEVIVQNQVAYRAGVTKQALSDWLKQGTRDLNEGNINTIFAQLSDRYHKARTEIVRDSLEKIQSGTDNYKALCWILEKCFREDFGAESEDIRELKELFKTILPMIGKGETINGQ